MGTGSTWYPQAVYVNYCMTNYSRYLIHPFKQAVVPVPVRYNGVVLVWCHSCHSSRDTACSDDSNTQIFKPHIAIYNSDKSPCALMRSYMYKVNHVLQGLLSSQQLVRNSRSSRRHHLCAALAV